MHDFSQYSPKNPPRVNVTGLDRAEAIRHATISAAARTIIGDGYRRPKVNGRHAWYYDEGSEAGRAYLVRTSTETGVPFALDVDLADATKGELFEEGNRVKAIHEMMLACGGTGAEEEVAAGPHYDDPAPRATQYTDADQTADQNYDGPREAPETVKARTPRRRSAPKKAAA